MDSPVTVTRIPDPAEPIPRVALPTLLLLIGSLIVLSVSCWLALTETWPVLVSTVINAVCAYLMFTVAHDATHSAASSNRTLNLWIGRIATPFFAQAASFQALRFIHMQHHRFTNHGPGIDPDAYTMSGPGWQRPLRWLTVDLSYLVYYAKRIGPRPRREKTEVAVQFVLITGLMIWAVVAGYGWELVFLVIIPQRLAVGWLAFAFDYLPHNGLQLRPEEDRFKTTRNRVGAEWLISPLLLYQNYHLVHHLHPVVPFYRYLRVWRRNEAFYLGRDPALSTLGGRPLTADEYRQLRELADHD